MVRGQCFQQQVGRSNDGRQQVVEIVRDASGEAADRFHFLRRAQPLVGDPQTLFGAPALGHIAIVDDQGSDRGITEPVRNHHLQISPFSVLVPHAQVGQLRVDRRSR